MSVSDAWMHAGASVEHI